MMQVDVYIAMETMVDETLADEARRVSILQMMNFHQGADREKPICTSIR